MNKIFDRKECEQVLKLLQSCPFNYLKASYARFKLAEHLSNLGLVTIRGDYRKGTWAVKLSEPGKEILWYCKQECENNGSSAGILWFEKNQGRFYR